MSQRNKNKTMSKNEGKQRTIKKQFDKRRKDNKTLSQKREKGREKTLTEDNKKVHPACKRKKLQSLGAVAVIGLDKTSKIIGRYEILCSVKCTGN
jgi:hypothetical protein